MELEHQFTELLLKPWNWNRVSSGGAPWQPLPFQYPLTEQQGQDPVSKETLASRILIGNLTSLTV
jgi:hypothetical protein